MRKSKWYRHKEYRCPVCAKEFDKQMQLKNHVQDVHKQSFEFLDRIGKMVNNECNDRNDRNDNKGIYHDS